LGNQEKRGIRDSGFGKKLADSQQQTADCERKARKEKRRGIFPLTSDPVRQAHGPERVEGLSLVGRGRIRKRATIGCKARLPRALWALLRNSSLVSPPSTGGDEGEGE